MKRCVQYYEVYRVVYESTGHAKKGAWYMRTLKSLCQTERWWEREDGRERERDRETEKNRKILNGFNVFLMMWT